MLNANLYQPNIVLKQLVLMKVGVNINDIFFQHVRIGPTQYDLDSGV